jgi:hypothetical protein
MTTPQRPILGAEVPPSKEIATQGARPPSTTPPDMLIARHLPPWDLLPSDLLVVRRRAMKK